MSESTGLTSGGGGLIMFLLASLAVIGLAFMVTRLMARWQGFQNRGRRLRVLEGVPIGKDRALLLVAVGKEVLVVGSSDGGVHLVHKVEEPEALLGENWEQVTAAVEPRVPDVSLAGLESSIRGHLDKMRGLLNKPGGDSNA